MLPEFTHPPYYPISNGYVKYTDAELATAVGIPSSLLNEQPRLILIMAEGQTIRWRDDGGNPTTSDGMLLPPYGGKWIDSHFTSYKFIRTSPGAILHFLGYK